jgi:hypothetical protein
VARPSTFQRVGSKNPWTCYTFPDSGAEMTYTLITLIAPHGATYRLITTLAIPILVLTASYFLLIRKRNWLDHIVFLVALLWLVYEGVRFYSGEYIRIRLNETYGGNVQAILWFLGYLVSKRYLSLIKSDSLQGKALIIGLIGAGSVVLFIVFSIIYIVLVYIVDYWFPLPSSFMSR